LAAAFQLTAGIIRERAPLDWAPRYADWPGNAMAECRSFQDMVDAFRAMRMID
jgi:hypothetical protein